MDHFRCHKKDAYIDFSLKANLRPRKGRRLYSCQGGITGFNIAPHGELTVCMLSSHPSFNLNEYSFRKAWAKLAIILKYKYPIDSRCAECNKYLVCRTCPALAKLETGDEHLPIDYLCEIATKIIDRFKII